MSKQRTVVLVQRPPRERAAFLQGRILTLDDRIAWLSDELRRSMRERSATDRALARLRRVSGGGARKGKR